MCNLIQKLVANWHRIGFVDCPVIILQFLQLGVVVVVACFFSRSFFLQLWGLTSRKKKNMKTLNLLRQEAVKPLLLLQKNNNNNDARTGRVFYCASS